MPTSFRPNGTRNPNCFLFWCYVHYFKTDYRGIVVLLDEGAELRSTLGLKPVPNYSTLCYAERRLCTQPVFEPLLPQTIQQAQTQQVIPGPADTAVDATGLETHPGSRYYIKRKGTGSPRTRRAGWLNLSLACHRASHLLAGAGASQGASQDSPPFPPLIHPATTQRGCTGLRADAGYDAEPNHRLGRERYGIPTTLIALNKRATGRTWPQTPYRRPMKWNVAKARYQQPAAVAD